MDHLDGTYIIGTDDEDDDNTYVAPNTANRQVALDLGNSRIHVISRRLANIQQFRQELLPPQPLATTSGTTASTTDGPLDNTTHSASTTTRLSQTLTRLVNAAWEEHYPANRLWPHKPLTASNASHPRRDPRQSPEPPSWIWPAPATDSGFEPAPVWAQSDPFGQPGYALVHGLPLTAWEPTVECTRQHPSPHLSLRQCITDYEALFNGDQRLNGKVDGQLPITSLERLFFALWAARYHQLPKRNPNNHFEARRPNEKTADFLEDLLTRTNHPLPQLVNVAFDSVVAGTPAPHFSVGDLRITLLRWYESCPASRKFLDDHVSGPANMELSNLDLYRPDIRLQLDTLFREHFADALDALRLRVYNVGLKRKPMWRLPRAPRQLPSHEPDPAVWRIRPDRILNNENVIFADSWGLRLAPSGNATTVIVSGPSDRALQTAKKYFFSHRVKNVYWFWGRDSLSDSVHDITADWYASLTEHFVHWFPHARLFVLMPPYIRENDHYWSYRIKRGVLAELRDYCLNATVICHPLDLKLHDYHEQYILNGSWQFGYPPWPTEEQNAEGTPSAEGLRRRKTYMKEKCGITLWDHETNDSMDTDQPDSAREELLPGPSGSSPTASARYSISRSDTPPPILGDAPGLVLINQLRGMFPDPAALQTQMRDVSRFLNVLHQLESPVHTPTWRAVYPALSPRDAVNLWGAYKHLAWSTIPQEQDNDDVDAPLNPDPGHPPAATAAGSLSPSGQPVGTAYVPHNPSTGHPSVATAAGGCSPSGRIVDSPRNPGLGHPSVATAAGGRSLPGTITSDTIRTRTSSTEQRRGTLRTSSRGQPETRRYDQPRLDEGRRGH